MRTIRLPQTDQDRLRRLLAEADGRGAEHADSPSSSPRSAAAGESLRRYCDQLRARYIGQAPQPGTRQTGRKTLQQMRAELARAEREV